MGGLFDNLTVAGNALGAQQYGAQITGGNIANVNAPGFHRQDVQLTSGSQGGGIETAGAKRASQNLLEQNANSSASSFAYADARAQGLVQVQGAVGDMGPNGIGAALGDFFSSWRNLAAAPQDMAPRNNVLARLQTLVTTLNVAAQSLVAQRSQADQGVVQTVEAANVAIQSIADLNRTITAAESGGARANDLRDQRDLAAQQLASSLGATSFTDEKGNVNVLLDNGVSLVSGISATLLTTTADATSGMHHVTTLNTTQGTLDGSINSGTLGGLLTLRDADIPASQAALDQVAYDLTNATNSVHSVGFGLDGATGRNLLTPQAQQGAAAAVSIDASVAGDPSALAASGSAATLPGDNLNATAMVALQDAMVAGGNTQTLGQQVSTMLGSVGNTVSSANRNSAQAQVTMQQSRTLAEQQIGVSIEDQMLQLNRYQTAYSAATRLVSTINTMLESLTRM